jgi:hypothetical protein
MARKSRQSQGVTRPGTRATEAPPSPRALAGGRLSLDNASIFIGATPIIEPPGFPEDVWHVGKLDSKTLSRISAGALSGLLVDLSPEVSRGLYDFLRECNPGWELEALRPGTDEQDPVAQAALDAWVAQLGDLYGSPDVVLNRLFISAWMRGAVLAELVLDEAGRAPVDFATPDPYWIRFQRISDPVRGTVHQLGQFQGGRFVPLDRPTITYIPVDPVPGVPYGRSLVAPALFTALFLIGILHDLRRVVSQQGYPRPDIEIDLEVLSKQMPSELQGDPTAQQVWLQGIVDAVSTAYGSLEPDDAYVHTSVVRLNKPMGTVDAASLGGLDAIIQALERMAVRALKTAPFMMAMTQSTTETQANRQWEQHLQGIKSIQHLVEAVVQRLGTIVLQVQGIVATVEMRFAENRAAELLRDAQVDVLKLNYATGAYTAGFLSQDEASQYAAGKNADVPEPRATIAAIAQPTVPPNTVNPDPGANRSARSRRARLVPKGADRPFEPIPASTLGEDDGDRLAELWDDSVDAKHAGMLRAVVTNGEAD